MATNTSSQTQQAETATVHTIDPGHSVASFGVRHLGIATFRGTVPIASGTLHGDLDDPTDLRLEAAVDISHLKTGNEDRDGHLHSEEFFNTAEHPTIDFESTKVKADGEDTYQIEGDLTIAGTTRPVVLEARHKGSAVDPWGGHREGFVATTTLDRREFGLKWQEELKHGGVVLGNKVALRLDVELVRQENEDADEETA